MSASVEKIITDRILAEMANGVCPWHRPWFGSDNGPVSHRNGRPYSMLNQLLLGGVDNDAEFATLRQVNDEGGWVKKGSRQKTVTFWKVVRVKTGEKSEDGKEKTKSIPILRLYGVFDVAADCEGVQTKYTGASRKQASHEPNAEGERIVSDYFGREGAPSLSRDRVSGRAYYSPALDSVNVPNIAQFPDLGEYYSTLFHEMAHSTGHASRLDRPDGIFGSREYAREELVAELSAASLLHRIGLDTPETFKNSAAYIEGWSKHLRNDPKLFIVACSRAEKAVRLILTGEMPEGGRDGEPATEPATEAAD